MAVQSLCSAAVQTKIQARLFARLANAAEKVEDAFNLERLPEPKDEDDDKDEDEKRKRRR